MVQSVAAARHFIQEGAGLERLMPAEAKVVGMGGCGVDYLAQVAAFPQPDAKLRTEQLEVQGGGNCGNALTAAARLGLSASIVSKIGGDSLGDGIVAEFHGDAVGTAQLLRATGAPSPFTYIIVDRQGNEPFREEELTPELAAAALGGASLVYFDGRLTEPAIQLAAAAKAAGVPILVEGERLRPHIEELLQYADYVVTSTHFPQEWTGEACLGDAILSTFYQLPRAKWMVTTLGARGSVLLERPSSTAPDGVGTPAKVATLEELMHASLPTKAHGGDDHNQQQQQQQPGMGPAAPTGNGSTSGPGASERPLPTSPDSMRPACTSRSGVQIWDGSVFEHKPCRLRLRRGGALGSGGGQELAARRAAAAQAAAAANADAGRAGRYAGNSSMAGVAAEELVARVLLAEAAKLPGGAVLDTTGAGDSFIGSLLYSLATRQPLKEALRLAAVVAACNCTALGARAGLPRRQDLRSDLL
ncbi:hypothetical protein N2152v2_009084 [Parachlorella kessleri]